MATPETKTLSSTDVRQQFIKLLDQVFRSKTRVVVVKNSVSVAAIISTGDLERLELYEEARRERFAVLDRIGEAFKDVPLDEIEREVALAVTEVRDDLRLESEGQSQT